MKKKRIIFEIGSGVWIPMPNQENLEKVQRDGWINSYEKLAKWFQKNNPNTEVKEKSDIFNSMIHIHRDSVLNKYGFYDFPNGTEVDNTGGRLSFTAKREKLKGKEAGKAIYWATWEAMKSQKNRKVFDQYFKDKAKPNYDPFDPDNPLVAKYGRQLVHTLVDIVGVVDPTGIADTINILLYFQDYENADKELTAIFNRGLEPDAARSLINEQEEIKSAAVSGAIASLIGALAPVIGDIAKGAKVLSAAYVLIPLIKRISRAIPRLSKFCERLLLHLGDPETIAKFASRATKGKFVPINVDEAKELIGNFLISRIPKNKQEFLGITAIQSAIYFATNTEWGQKLVSVLLSLPNWIAQGILKIFYNSNDLDMAVDFLSRSQFFKEDPITGSTIYSRIRDLLKETYREVQVQLEKAEKPSVELPQDLVYENKNMNFNDLKKLVEQVLREELLLEGGAGGHMRHPFDLDDVKTGMDLLRKFEQIGKQIKAGARPDTKIDGVNTSIKVIDGPNGKEFAMDRGSGKPEDIEGMTVDRLLNRFGEGHGMVTAGKNVLNIFNDALPEISPELKELGLLDDPSKFFNMEYVKGTTNVLAYDHDFLKIHGVNQFYNKKDRKGSIIRPGAERPLDPETGKEIKDPAVPASYNKEAMEKMVEILNKYSEKYGFKVYSSIGSKAVGNFDFTPVLSVPAPVTYSEGNVDQKTLGERLKVAKNRIGETVKTVDGRKPPAQGKEIYKAVLGAAATDKNADPNRQVPLSRMLQSEEDYQKAIDGAVFWHATRLFGNVIIENMEVDHPAVKGPAKDHEGLVIRLPGDDFDIKITGEFILGGEASAFRSDSPEPAKKAKTVGIFPGSFKPPHKGHLSVIKGVLQNPEIDEVKVIISAPSKEVRSPKITPEKAKEVFEKYIAASNFTKPVSVEVATKPSPIGVAYEYIGEKAEPNETVVLLTSQADASRYPQSVLDKAVSMNKNASTIKAKSLVLPACRDEGCSTAEKVSATTIRNIIDAFPNVTIEDVKRATSLMPDEMPMPDKLSVFELLVGEPLTSKFGEEEIEGIKSLEETSVAGSISGYAGTVNKKEEDRTIYNMKQKLSLEENILKEYLVEKYVEKFKTLIKEVDAATATGMTYVTDAFSTTKSNFEKRFGGLGEQDQRISFLVNFLNKMVHGFIQQDVGEGIPPVMPFDELVEKGILTFDISQSAQEFAQSALEEGELNEQEGEEEAPVEEPAAPKGKKEAPAEEPAAPEAEGGDIEGLVPDEDADAEAEKEKEQQDKMKAGQISPEVTEEPLPNTNETGNRAALAYYKLDSKNIFRFYNLIGPEDTADREQFIEFYFKNVIALAAGIERSKSGNLPEPLNTMFNKLSTGSDVVKEPQLETPAAETPAAPLTAPEAVPAAPLQEGDISRIIKNSVINTFNRLQFR